MGMVDADPVKVDLRGLEKFDEIINKDLRKGGNGPIRAAMKQWAARYRGFVQRRFVKFSRGGGDWQPLKNKRRRGKKGKAALLRDTNTMFAALDPQFQRKPGQLQKDVPFGIKVGYGGGGSHPISSLSVTKLAELHQTGEGNLPARQMIVEPDQQTVKGMAADMQRAMGKLAQGTINAAR